MRSPLHPWLMSVALLVGAIVGAPAFAAEVEPVATPEELRQLYEQGQYQPLLAKLPRALALKGAAAAKYDMVELNLLKADTFIQLKQQQPATTATADAVKAISPGTDAKLAARARAQQILLKQSQGLAYTPKASPAQKLPLADPGQRQAAYGALMADMQAEITKRIKAAQASRTLPPIITAVQGLADMAAVELTATNSDANSRGAADDLAAGGKKLMGDNVALMASRHAVIDKAANVVIRNPVREVEVGGGRNPRRVPVESYRKVGLTSQNRAELKEIADTCARIEAVCAEFVGVSKDHAAGFHDVATAAAKTGQDANGTLTADYLTDIASPTGGSR